MRKVIVGIILIALIFFGVQLFLSRKSIVQPSGRLQVAASFYPLYFFASKIGGEKAEVTNVTPVGVEPHDYEPSPRDLVKIQQSNMVVINGAGLEPWADKVKQELSQKKVAIVIASEGLSLMKGVSEEGSGSVTDPHIWLDPVLAQEEVKKIITGYRGIDLADQSYYEAQGQELISKLQNLDAEYRDGLASCQTRDFVTSHAAFGYLAKRYNLKQVGIRGLSPEAEPTAAELVEVVDFAKKNNVKYIFFEELISPKLSETIAREVGAQTLVLSPIEGLSEEEQEQGADYFAKMKENLKNLRVALACQ